MAKKNSTASKKPMIFNSVIMINAENVVSLVKCLPKTRMKEEAFNTYMENSFIFGGKNHGKDFNAGSHYSTVVRQLGLYHILNNEYIPRFTFDIDNKTADSYLRYWLKLYVVPNPTSQPSLKKNTINPKYILKELIEFIEANPSPTNIYDIVDKIFNQELSRNDKGNLPNIIKEYSDCISINDNNEVSLTSNYKQVMADINELINNPNRYFEHFGTIQAPSSTMNKSLQIIFYGAPGTGKSYRIKEQLINVPKENIFRTTFHPDSDYSTFVGAYKPTMKKQYRYDGKVKAKYYEDDDLADAKKDDVIIDKIIQYNFVPQTFLKAYIRAYQTNDNVYLLIEEINRGNCAQIFGDLFQLLDRDENGVSEYTIKADADVRAYLEDSLGQDSKGIKDGELCLPSNLYIYATMNTSDQSLFPIDSAFKRRWDWEYEPIKYKNIDWVIEINGINYSWTSFQKEVNTRIFDVTNSEDKMLGDYFIKPYNRVISKELLLNKVLFYLWNDVCKDGDDDIFKTDDNKDVKFSDLYGDKGTEMLLSMMRHLKVSIVPENLEDGEEDSVGVGVRYSINGEDHDKSGKDWGKRALVKRAVEIYCENHLNHTAEQIRDAWMSIHFKIPHIVETKEDKDKRVAKSEDKSNPVRAKEIQLHNGDSIFVSTEVGNDAQSDRFGDFIDKMQKQADWGITIQKL